MNFLNLELKQFRNISNQTIFFSPFLNIFYGQNGQGKTNLIEAIHFLTCGKSFRGGETELLVNKNDFNGFSLKSEIFSKGIQKQVKTKFFDKKKTFFIDEKKTTISKIRKNFFSVLFSPETLQVIKDSDGKRRDLIDNLCFCIFPDFYPVYKDWQRLLRQKNIFLKKIKSQKTIKTSDRDLEQTITLQFLKKSSELCVFRFMGIKKIENFIASEFRKITGSDFSEIFIKYSFLENRNQNPEKEEFFYTMHKKWKTLGHLERATGQCLVGPHKDSVKFIFNGKNARFFCSQGQQRAIILSFKTAQTELYREIHKETPILLLDDVLSELDSCIQTRLLNRLETIKGQIFLTTTKENFSEKDNKTKIFLVKKGGFYARDFLTEKTKNLKKEINV